MPIVVRSKGNFKRTKSLLSFKPDQRIAERLDYYGQLGADALAEATPVDTGKTAASWSYQIAYKDDSARLVWNNSNVNNHQNIAILIQYGHATGTGGWVEGVDYINPALKPIFDKIATDLWKEVSNS